MPQIITKFGILNWKNLLLKWRHWVQTLFEILVPTVLFMAIVAIRSEGGENITPVLKPEQTFDVVPLALQFCTNMATYLNKDKSLKNQTLLYTTANTDNYDPAKNKLIEDVFEKVRNFVGIAEPLCYQLIISRFNSTQVTNNTVSFPTLRK